MQQKVQFISTILHDPTLLILDEPFAGLDPVNSEVMKDTVLDLARKGATVLFSTHIMEHAEKLCDSVCIIARGEKVVDGPVAEVKREPGSLGSRSPRPPSIRSSSIWLVRRRRTPPRARRRPMHKTWVVIRREFI